MRVFLASYLLSFLSFAGNQTLKLNCNVNDLQGKRVGKLNVTVPLYEEITPLGSASKFAIYSTKPSTALTPLITSSPIPAFNPIYIFINMTLLQISSETTLASAILNYEDLSQNKSTFGVKADFDYLGPRKTLDLDIYSGELLDGYIKQVEGALSFPIKDELVKASTGSFLNKTIQVKTTSKSGTKFLLDEKAYGCNLQVRPAQ